MDANLAIWVVFTLSKLLKDSLIVEIILLLLPLLDVSEEFLLLLRGVAHVQEYLVLVLQVPVMVVDQVSHIEGVNLFG